MPTSMDKDAFEMNKNTLLSILSNEEEMGLFVGELEKKCMKQLQSLSLLLPAIIGT